MCEYSTKTTPVFLPTDIEASSKLKIYFFSGTRQNIWLDKNTVGQLIFTARQNVRHNKHSIGQNTITIVDFFNVKKNKSRTKKKTFS